MFERVKYKTFAKKQLTGRYLIPFLMVLIVNVVVNILSIPINNIVKNLFQPFLQEMTNALIYNDTSFFTSPEYVRMYTEMVTSSGYLLSQLLQILIYIVKFVFSYAAINVYIQMSRSPEPVKFSTYIEGFSNWIRAILSGFWESLFVFFWSLLFVIPGIIKAYAYSQMIYLVVEFPELSIRKAMKISMKITKGHKWDLFVLDLSFIGWFLLVAISLGVAGFYVTPYCSMTKVNAFHGLLKEAIEKGLVTLDELGVKQETKEIENE